MLPFIFGLNQRTAVEDTYLYVDGESHYIGTENCWSAIHTGQGIETISERPGSSGVTNCGFAIEPRFTLHKKAKFFWDSQLTNLTVATWNYIHRAVYVTSIVGDEPAEHEAARYIRDAGFEPLIMREHQQLEKARASEIE